MASFTEHIQVLIDTDTSKAGSALGNFKTKLGEAEGAVAKLKVGAGAAFDAIASPAGLAAAGAAVGAFVVKAIGDFQDLALSVDAFTQKTGVSADTASRWVEVGDDLGVSADTVATAMGRFQREDASGAIAKYGLTAHDTSGRFQEMLAQIGAIPDANERARVAFQVFGKSWQALTPLIDKTVDLKGRLDDVSGAKLITDKQIKDAREFRDAMDTLSDAAQNLEYTAAKALIPFLTSLADSAGPIAEFVANVLDARQALEEKSSAGQGSWWDDMVAVVVSTGPEFVNIVGRAVDEVTGLGGASDGTARSLQTATSRVENQSAAAKTLEENTDATKAALDAFTQAQKEGQAAVDGLTAALVGQFDSLSKNTTSMLDAQSQQIKTNQSLQDYGKTLGDTKLTADDHTLALNEMTTQLIDTGLKTAEATTATMTFGSETEAAGVKAGIQKQYLQAVADTLEPGSPLRVALEGYITKLDEIKTDITTQVNVDLDRAARQLANWEAQPRSLTYTVNTITSNTGHAAGGPIRADEVALVGEKGPELVALPGGSYVYTAAQTTKLLAGGMAGGGYTSVSTMPKSGLLPFGWWEDANGVHAPTTKGSGENSFVPIIPPPLPPPPRVDAEGAMLGGGARGTTTIIVNTGANPQEVIEAIRKYERMNGTAWRN